MTRLRLLALLLVALVGLTAAPALAAGTGGIEVTPVPGVVDGRQVTAFHVSVPSRGSTSVAFALRGAGAAVATGRLYAARAVADGKGGFSIGEAGSSPYVSMPSATVTLQPKEVRAATFRVHAGPHGRPGSGSYAAIVVEVRKGAVVQRAATLVYLKAGRRVPLPLLLVLIAGGLVAVTATALVLVRRRRQSTS